MDLVDVIVPFHLQHNAEAEAVDLLLEVQQLPKLLSSGQLDHQNARRASEYLLRCADFLADPDDVRQVMETAFQLYLRHDDCADALRVALRARNSEQLQQVFQVRLPCAVLHAWRASRAPCLPPTLQACTDPAKRLQLAFVLGRHRAFNVRLEGAADAAHLHATVRHTTPRCAASAHAAAADREREAVRVLPPAGARPGGDGGQNARRHLQDAPGGHGPRDATRGRRTGGRVCAAERRQHLRERLCERGLRRGQAHHRDGRERANGVGVQE